MISVVATFVVMQGETEAFEKRFMAQAAAVRANEPDCVLYSLCRSEDPNTYVAIERYTDMDSFEHHRTSDHMSQHRPGVLETLEVPVEVQILEEID